MNKFKRLTAIGLVVVMSFANGVTTFANIDNDRCELTEAVQAGKNLSVILSMFPDLDEKYIQSAFEQEVIRLVNEIRYGYGLPALIYHPELAHIARLRAEETVRYSKIQFTGAYLTNNRASTRRTRKSNGIGCATCRRKLDRWTELPGKRG